MVRRCQDPKVRFYQEYGGRGITVAPQWKGRGGFKTFLRDMGPKPPLTSLDRMDNNGRYEPANCRWASAQVQAANRRFCRYVMIEGRRVTIQEAARALGMPPTTLRGRLLRGKMPLERAVTHGRLPYRKDSHFLTHNGVTQSVPEWARALGLRVRTLRERLRRKTPLDRALRPM